MKYWSIEKPKTATFYLDEQTNQTGDPNMIKVKITLTEISKTDLDIFTGDYKNAKYPIIPSRIAIGLVSEALTDTYKKGEKVLLHPYIQNKLNKTLISGVTKDGYLSDYVIVPLSDIEVLPEKIENKEAIFIEDIALGLNAIEELDLKETNFCLFQGVSAKSCIAAQIALEHNIIPIMVDFSQERLDIATNLGVYYTINTQKAKAFDKINELTGGKMANGLIIDCDAFKPDVDILNYLSIDGKVCFTGYSSPQNSMRLDLRPAIANNLKIFGINSGVGSISTAINLLANNKISTENLFNKPFNLADAGKKMDKLSNQANYFKNLVLC